MTSASACWRKRAVRSSRPEATVGQPRALALGATTVESFRASPDGCITGRGKLDVNVNCIPNFGALELTDLTVDDPSVVSATLNPRGGSLDTASVTLKALSVGRTTLRARSHVGLATSTIALPLEVAVPDRVTVEGFEDLLVARSFVSARLHAFHADQELIWEGLQLLKLDGPGELSSAGQGWSLRVHDAGQRGRITSPYDPTVSLAFEVFALSEVSLAVDVLPEARCERRVVPRVSARGKPLRAEFGMGPAVVVDVKYPFDSCAPEHPPQGLVSDGVALRWTGGAGECRVEVSIRDGSGPHARFETLVPLARPCVR